LTDFLVFKPSKISAARRQWSQALAAGNVVEPVTPAGGAIRVAGEEDAGWASFFDGSTAVDFLWINES
jgi:hypothetical protein